MEWTVPQDFAGRPLDRFLKSTASALPVSALFKLLRKKKIKVNGVVVREMKTSLAQGDVVFLPDSALETSNRVQAAHSLPVLFEDLVLLVINKPRGMAVHSGKGESGRTVIDLLTAFAHDYTPRLVHRLDKFTSGVLVVAKERRAAGRLGDAFEKTGGSEVRKRYLAVVFGKAPATGRVANSLDGQDAQTLYVKIAERRWEQGVISLLDVKITTGRKHQIRRHLSSIGLPVVGDEDYGAWDLNKRFHEEFRIKGFLLHALSIRFVHPESRMPIEIEAPVSSEILSVFPAAGSYKKNKPRRNTDILR